jgi:hypothetical protein
MTPRSSRADVRNPVLRMSQVGELRKLPEPARKALANLLAAMSMDARAQADRAWKKHKAPMACYWKAVAVYAKHISRALQSPKT